MRSFATPPPKTGWPHTLFLCMWLACGCTAQLSAQGNTSSQPVHVEQGDCGNVALFLARHCLRCHGPKRSKAKLTLHTLEKDLSLGRDLERWEKVLEVLRRGEMPPEKEPQPADSERERVAKWIEKGLRSYVAKAERGDVEPQTRRLTNFEYQNTMRDLLGFELRLSERLPEDPSKPYEFQNRGEFMLLGPEQLDLYKANARRAMASAIVDAGRPDVHRAKREWKPLDPPERGMHYDEIGIYGNRRNSAAWGVGLKSWPERGAFRIRVKAAAILPEGFSEVPLRIVMGQDLNVNSSSRQMWPVGTLLLRNGVDEPKVFELRGRIENHPSLRSVFRGRKRHLLTITPQNLYDNGRLNDHLDPLSMPRVVVQRIEFEGPIADTWPPEHHTRILFDSPLRKTKPAAYARAVLQRFMSRAYRRPVTRDELDRFVKIHAVLAAKAKSLEDAMRETLSMVLISPQFLYHTVAEKDVATRQYEIASRLSYFLWGSMPDTALLELATANKLDDPAVIERQVQRLLADARSKDFCESFVTQWLSIAKAKAVKINASLFPRFLYLVARGERRGTEVPYRPTIRDFMHEETVGFVRELIRRNASALQIVDSDFAWLNEALAAHYGVKGVRGYAFRAVPLEPEHRLGGLLTQGSVLVANSTGSAPHPIYRAVWLREAILGDEVRDPPAEVPALVDSAGDAAEQAVTIKELLRKHRVQPSCAECHDRLDPWGIPFERYNAIGKFQPRVPKDGVRVRGFDPRRDKTLARYPRLRRQPQHRDRAGRRTRPPRRQGRWATRPQAAPPAAPQGRHCAQPTAQTPELRDRPQAELPRSLRGRRALCPVQAKRPPTPRYDRRHLPEPAVSRCVGQDRTRPPSPKPRRGVARSLPRHAHCDPARRPVGRLGAGGDSER